MQFGGDLGEFICVDIAKLPPFHTNYQKAGNSHIKGEKTGLKCIIHA
jgi:hypothetical protein